MQATSHQGDFYSAQVVDAKQTRPSPALQRGCGYARLATRVNFFVSYTLCTAEILYPILNTHCTYMYMYIHSASTIILYTCTCIIQACEKEYWWVREANMLVAHVTSQTLVWGWQSGASLPTSRPQSKPQSRATHPALGTAWPHGGEMCIYVTK